MLSFLSSSFRISPLLKIALLLTIALPAPAALCQGQSSYRPEEIEWTWEVRPTAVDPKLPNVLLLGDSITRAYFPQVQKDLAGVANVYLMASSTSVGDPRIAAQIHEFAVMEGVRFRVVHFNNGMHGWAYSEAEFEASFRDFIASNRNLLEEHGQLIWASITPVRIDQPGGASNARIDARNALTAKIIRSEKIAIDDQHALMLHHQDMHSDDVHFTDEGAALEGDQAAASIRTALAQAR